MNIVPVDTEVTLGYGLDFRADRYGISEACIQQIYATKADLSTSDTAIDNINSYYFPSTAETIQFSSSNNSDTMTLAVIYFGSSSDTTTTTTTVTLTGQTPVTLGVSVYRINRITVISTINAGTVYMYKSGTSVSSGVPSSNILCCIAPGIGYSRQSFLYVPYGWTAYLISMKLLSNASTSNTINLTAYRQSAAITLPVQDIPVNAAFIEFEENGAPGIAANTTYQIVANKANVLNTAKFTILYNFVLLRTT